MKKLACVALSAGMATLALGCGSSDGGGPPTILFDWGPAADCPDLLAAGREASVIINGVDFDGIADDEQLIFDCEDGESGVIDLQDGDWDFDLEVVDDYDDALTDPFECFDETLNGDACLYYTTTNSRVENVDTFVDFDPDVLVDFAYGFGNFTIDYAVDGLSDPAEELDCQGWDPVATDMSVVITFYSGAGFVEDQFACGVENPADTRDLPLDDYELSIDLLDSTGAALSEEPAEPTTQTLATHLENVLIEVNLDEAL